MRQRHFPGSLTDWVSPFLCCVLLHPPTNLLYFFFLERWCWQRCSQNKRLHCLDWLPLLTPYSLLQVRLSAEALAVHIRITKSVNAAQLAVSGSNGREWSLERPHTVCQTLDMLVFVCFDSSLSATVWFLDSKHLAVPIKIPQHKWPQHIGAGEHCGAGILAISRVFWFSHVDFVLMVIGKEKHWFRFQQNVMLFNLQATLHN